MPIPKYIAIPAWAGIKTLRYDPNETQREENEAKKRPPRIKMSRITLFDLEPGIKFIFKNGMKQIQKAIGSCSRMLCLQKLTNRYLISTCGLRILLSNT
jgi:hypothetical protein